mmetsp:Transcript_7632/g.11843  ORF Transcript_7632/g.11843 Transcript_7632/m.11843 type:complete len:141 (+) Transcript_7632:166-588(+)
MRAGERKPSQKRTRRTTRKRSEACGNAAVSQKPNCETGRAHNGRRGALAQPSHNGHMRRNQRRLDTAAVQFVPGSVVAALDFGLEAADLLETHHPLGPRIPLSLPLGPAPSLRFARALSLPRSVSLLPRPDAGPELRGQV